MLKHWILIWLNLHPGHSLECYCYIRMCQEHMEVHHMYIYR